MRVLVVDDEVAMRRMLRSQLRHAGYVVDEAADGAEAWALLQREPIRLVITDWLMPAMSGTELIRAIRAADIPAYTYIIMLTARDGKGDVVEALEAGADDCLTKPFDVGELRARVAIGGRILALEARLRDSLAKLEDMTAHDDVTGLYNRRALYHHMEAELSRSSRAGGPVSLVLLDIDHFKDVNDRFGHLVGDQALRLVAQVIVRGKRPYDWVGRWGGDEFMLILPGTGLAQAVAVAERIREAAEAADLSLEAGRVVRLRVSLGVTTAPASPGPAASVLPMLVQQADEALYAAKREGRGRVCVFTEARRAPG